MPSFKRVSQLATLAAATRATTSSSSLSDLCTVSNIQSLLPSNGTLLGINVLPDTVTASVTNTSSSAGGMGPMRRQAGPSSSSASSETYTYCNVTFAFTHAGKDDTVNVKYAFPSPDDFENRFYLAGGGGYALSTDATGGLAYGAASGATDAGYDAFNYDFDEKFLYANGSINWDATYAFGYQALGELTQVGKYITPLFYGLDDSTKVYSYFSGCSDGGRQAMSQIQRWGKQYDGVVAGAPAFRYAQQQVNHVFPAVVEVVQDHAPKPCALQKIVNATIAACDPLDGRTDGVVARSDLCKLNFNLTDVIGESYYCAAQTSTSLGFGFSRRADGSQSSTTPEQNGTVSDKDVAVAQAIYDGLINSEGKQAYLSWQIASSLSDGEPTYNNETDSYEANVPSTGGEFITKFVQLLDLDNLSSLDNVTYDTLVDWMDIAFNRYYDSLQTTLPDLTPFKSNGGKLIHYHGESDPSVPAPSSVRYRNSVREAMYPNLSVSEGESKLNDWYQFYLVPGAAHCGANSLQPGPYPQDLMNQIIDWVENGSEPTGLNATVSSGDYEGETQMLCKWPTRPLWSSDSEFDCVEDDASIESWNYDFPAFKQAVY